MKKRLISYFLVCVCMLSLLSLAAAPAKAAGTVSLEEIEAAIDYAYNEMDTRPDYWKGYCAALVWAAYKRGAGMNNKSYSTARQMGDALISHTDGNPPRGALVFWYDKENPKKSAGHVGLSLGDGRVIHAYSAVKVSKISTVNSHGYIYRGWGAPVKDCSLATEAPAEPALTAKNCTMWVDLDKLSVLRLCASWSGSAKTLADIPGGESVYVLGVTQEAYENCLWAKVRYQGQEGWVDFSYLSQQGNSSGTLSADHYTDSIGSSYAGNSTQFILTAGGALSSGYYLQYQASNSLCTLQWGSWNGSDCPLWVRVADPYQSGDCIITVRMCRSADDTVLGSATLRVSVLGKTRPAGFQNFSDMFYSMHFQDVEPGLWYYAGIAKACALGLAKGESDLRFNVLGSVTLAEAVTMAARLHSIYYNDGTDFTQGSSWYQVYVDYALEKGILKRDYGDYSRKATRGEFAEIFAAALPPEALAERNEIADGQIPDVPADRPDAEAIYLLYRAGILTGNDEWGYYAPDSSISRAEMATLAARMAVPELRKNFRLPLMVF